MKIKTNPDREYHFEKLPFPPKLTIEDAENSVVRINNLLVAIRQELFDLNVRRGYLLLGYKNMPTLVKSRIEEMSPRYVHGLLNATKLEKSMELNMPIGTVPYLALMLLKSFPIERIEELWKRASNQRLTGETRVSALRRVIQSYRVTQ
jgi:hypothetical protein